MPAHPWSVPLSMIVHEVVGRSSMRSGLLWSRCLALRATATDCISWRAATLLVRVRVGISCNKNTAGVSKISHYVVRRSVLAL